MTNGLDSLEAKRGRGRPIPPSAHKPRQTPVEMPEAPLAASQGADEADPAGQAIPERAVGATGAVARRSIHLAPGDDEFLEAVFMAGRQDLAGKFDASRSAVVRLALTRLASEMTPQMSCPNSRS